MTPTLAQPEWFRQLLYTAGVGRPHDLERLLENVTLTPGQCMDTLSTMLVNQAPGIVSKRMLNLLVSRNRH